MLLVVGAVLPDNANLKVYRVYGGFAPKDSGDPHARKRKSA